MHASRHSIPALEAGAEQELAQSSMGRVIAQDNMLPAGRQSQQVYMVELIICSSILRQPKKASAIQSPFKWVTELCILGLCRAGSSGLSPTIA